MIIVINKYMSYAGMAIWPFILLKKDSYRNLPALINHERIHLRQQTELLLLPFYVLYFANYLMNIIKYRNHDKAYRNIIFEREAFANDRNLNYLNERKWFSAFKYWKSVQNAT